jgi:hypothetical protein
MLPGEPRDSGGLGPASPEGSEMDGAAVAPPDVNLEPVRKSAPTVTGGGCRGERRTLPPTSIESGPS